VTWKIAVIMYLEGVEKYMGKKRWGKILEKQTAKTLYSW